MATRVLILGGGFAGLEAARHLSRCRESHHLSIQLVNRHRWSLFSPLLPDLVSGRINPHHIAYPLHHSAEARDTVHPCRGEVHRPREEVGVTTEGRLQADFILLCLGCETNYHGHDEFVHGAPGLKSLVEGVELRMRVKALMDGKAGEEDKAGHIVVCGAGYTGSRWPVTRRCTSAT